MSSDRRAHVKYEVIQVYDPSKNYTEHIQKRWGEILEKFDTMGYTFSPKDFYNQNKSMMESKNRSKNSAKSILTMSLNLGTKIGVLKKRDESAVPDWFKELESVKYWQDQLRGDKRKNLKVGSTGTTKSLYLGRLWNFNRWLSKQTMKIKITKQVSEDTFKQIQEFRTFENVEGLTSLLTQTIPNRIDVVKIIKKYLLDEEEHQGNACNYMNVIKAAILSYFTKNECDISVEFDPKNKYKNNEESLEQQQMSIAEFMTILTDGAPSLLEKAVFLCKFHRGLDASTLADRFNFEVFPQLVKAFGTEDHNAWDLSLCPIITEHSRVKTSFRHIGCLDVDAIAAIQKYLDERREITNQEMMVGKPLFLNKQKDPITQRWIFRHFHNLAKKSGVLRKLTEINAFNVDSHEVRDLLKSTLIVDGAADWAANIAIGHKPKDSYDKTDKLFPQKFRAEYAKGSKSINIFSRISSVIESEELPQNLEVINKLNEKNDNLSKRVQALEGKVDVKELEKKSIRKRNKWFKNNDDALPPEIEEAYRKYPEHDPRNIS